MKRVLSVIISALLLLAALPLAAQAASSGDCGSEGDNVVWTLDADGTLTLSGVGDMRDYSWDDSPWNQDAAVKALRVGEGVTSLGDYAFYNCTALAEITLPESLTAIGRYTFCGCESLTEAALPAAATEIGAGAFYGCAALTDVRLPQALSAVESYTFCGCAALSELALPEGLSSIGGSAFSGCAALSELALPQGLETIGGSAFYNCKSLSDVVLPDRVASVGKRAFSGCAGLRGVAFGAGITSVSEEAFRNCKSLSSLTLPEGVSSIGNGAFYGCAGLTAVSLPKSLTAVGSEAFYGCAALTEIALPEGLLTIGRAAFSQCAGLTDLTLPASLTAVGDAAFEGCGWLTGVVVPAADVQIGADAFPSQAVLYGADDSAVARWATDNDRAFAAPGAASLTLTGPSVVSERTVCVCGFTDPGAYVTCSLNGAPLLTVTASGSGKWNAELPLADAADGDTVTVGAAGAADMTVSREITVVYRSDAVAFRELTLEHNFYAVTVTRENFNIAKRNVTLAPDVPFSFRVRVSNSDTVRKLYVVSTKKGSEKKLELIYDEASDCWYGDGFFDEADHAYIPGTLTITGKAHDGSAVDAGVAVKMNFLKDPAGFVYEAVRSNKLADVTAAVYYRDEAGHELLWNAAAAEQDNPVPTLPDGAFSWAVPKGTWQIRLFKDGYQTARTEWMTVPPAQDQVFLPMVTLAAPTVESLSVYRDHADIVFSSYMEIASVNEETLSFEGYPGTITPLDAEETQQGSGVFYARSFRFTPAEAFAGPVKVTVYGAKNYAGTAMTAAMTAVTTASKEPGLFTATDAVAIRCGESAEITVFAENAAGKTVTVSRDGDAAQLSAETLTLDEDGSAKFTATGRMTGRVHLTFTLAGAGETAETEITVSLPRTVIPGDVDNDGFVTPADARLALRISVQLEACEEGSDTFRAADANRDGVIGPDDARLILRSSVGLESLD